MHFELSERLITTEPAEAIMHFAENQFGKVSDKTWVRNGALFVRRVEASFGSINRTDTTKVTLQRIAGGYLLVSETDYRPSIWFWLILIVLLFTYVGWLIPIAFYLYQRGTVRSAIQSCFDRVRNEFSSPPGYLPSAMPAANYIDDLKKLAELREAGVLSETEFDAEKQKILAKRR